jgi:hypothetical protein
MSIIGSHTVDLSCWSMKTMQVRRRPGSRANWRPTAGRPSIPGEVRVGAGVGGVREGARR